MNLKDYDREENQEEVPDYWITFSDLMSSLLMIFILFLSLALLQLNNEQEKVVSMEAEKIGVRQNIIEQLKTEFESSNLDIEVDHETGAIVFSEGVFFDYDVEYLKPIGKEYLSKFIPQYMDIVLSESNEAYISEIIIEGHTDDEGSYMYNLDLSQKRAFEVAKYILSEELSDLGEFHKTRLESILTANGRSYAYPILGDNGEIIEEKSRRVEVKFRLKNEAEMIEGV